MIIRKANYDIGSIIGQFEIEGQFFAAEAIGIGHINDTILIKIRSEGDPDYVLQRINHEIFRDVEKLMENIQRVTSHFQNSIAENNGSQTMSSLELVITKDQKYFYRDETGNYWRCYKYCINVFSATDHVTPALAFEGGRALGNFQAQLSNLPGGPLHDTIPDFHNLEKRLDLFWEAVKLDPVQRVQTAQPEIKAIRDREQEMLAVYQLGPTGKIPLRITHNDTKFNNILFDENAKAICLVDLDTVMNGYVLYDFGDAMRTLTNTAKEDETNIDLVNLNLELFEHFTKGYIRETRNMLNATEIKHLAWSAKMMTYIIGLRFLTDFILGDVYFKIGYASHNLDRARNQFALLKKMEEKFSVMEEIVSNIAAQKF